MRLRALLAAAVVLSTPGAAGAQCVPGSADSASVLRELRLFAFDTSAQVQAYKREARLEGIPPERLVVETCPRICRKVADGVARHYGLWPQRAQFLVITGPEAYYAYLPAVRENRVIYMVDRTLATFGVLSGSAPWE